MGDRSLQIVIASENSSRLLLLLDNGPKDCDELRKSLETTKDELLFNIELLEKYYLVTKENNVYRLTLLGNLVIEKLKPLLCMEKFVNFADGYWCKRRLDFAPPHLLKKLYEIDSCTLFQPSPVDIFECNREIHQISRNSESFRMIAAGLQPTFFNLFEDLIDEGVHLSLIFDSCFYSKVTRDNFDKLRKLVNNKQVTLYLYPHKMHLFSLKVNDSCLALRLLTAEGTYDYKQLICISPAAVEWGRELFEYYLENSTQITVI
ncbi:hypothetical protein Mpsy_0006 [Methanolobus psychrophilus R15]|nr:hypothetical protein Mpsy_0006 [Methanolobus psychrophilus R15]